MIRIVEAEINEEEYVRKQNQEIKFQNLKNYLNS